MANMGYKFVLLVFTVSAVRPQVTSLSTNPLVIDHDGGADDAMAIFMALLSEKYLNGPNVIAITTSHGNVDEYQTFNNTQRLLNIAERRDIPIYRGSNVSLVETYPTDHFFGLDGLGDVEETRNYSAIPAQSAHAANALIELSKTYEGKLTLVVIGALTNIALAVRLDPLFISRLKHLYIGAGNIADENYTDPEFNALIDVEAYHIVAEGSVSDIVTAIPFSTVLENHDSSSNFSMEWRLNDLAAINTTIIQMQNQFERVSLSKTTRWTLLDPYVMAMVLNETLIGNITCSQNSINLCGADRGVNTNIFADCSNKRAVNMKIAYPSKEVDVLDFIYSVFASALK